MKRRIVADSSIKNNTDVKGLNVMTNSTIEMLMKLGFKELQDYSGAYAILDEAEKNIVCYDDNSGTFSVVEGGALNDKGATFMEYINEKDGWEVFLEDYPEVKIVDYTSLEEALRW